MRPRYQFEKFMVFTPIQKILPKTINKFGIKREVEAAAICEKYRKLAPRFVHANALDHTFPKFYRRKTLTVAVINAGWAHQVISNKKPLLDAINKSLGACTVTELRTQVVDALPGTDASAFNFSK